MLMMIGVHAKYIAHGCEQARLQNAIPRPTSTYYVPLDSFQTSIRRSLNPAVGPLRWRGNLCYCLSRSELIVTSEPECFRCFSRSR